MESPFAVHRLRLEDRYIGRPKPLEERLLVVNSIPVDPIERSSVEASNSIGAVDSRVVGCRLLEGGAVVVDRSQIRK